MLKGASFHPIREKHLLQSVTRKTALSLLNGKSLSKKWDERRRKSRLLDHIFADALNFGWSTKTEEWWKNSDLKIRNIKTRFYEETFIIKMFFWWSSRNDFSLFFRRTKPETFSIFIVTTLLLWSLRETFPHDCMNHIESNNKSSSCRGSSTTVSVCEDVMSNGVELGVRGSIRWLRVLTRVRRLSRG